MTTSEPQTQPEHKAQTALELWNEQLQGLSDPAQSDAAINTIYERLMKLHGTFVKNEMPKQAGQVEEAYNLALSIYNNLQQRQTLIVGGAAAISESEGQRQQTLAELAQLMKAITDGDESHPKLADYAAGIREEESMDSYEMAYQEIDENITEQIVEAWDVEWEEADQVLMAVLGRPEPKLTEHQKSLFQAFIDSLKVDADDEGDDDDNL